MLFLPAPPRLLLLAPPRDIKVGSFVRFNSLFMVRQSWNWNHWAFVYGNGVGIVRKITEWDVGQKSATIDFPHRMECHNIKYIELDHRATRAISMLKWGPMYGPEIRLAAPRSAA